MSWSRRELPSCVHTSETPTCRGDHRTLPQKGLTREGAGNDVQGMRTVLDPSTKSARFKCNRFKKIRAKPPPTPTTSTLPENGPSTKIHFPQRALTSLGQCTIRNKRTRPRRLMSFCLLVRARAKCISDYAETLARMSSRGL
jgi:hypothetical protein